MININEAIMPILEDKEAYDLIHANLCRIMVTEFAKSPHYQSSFGKIIWESAYMFLNMWKTEDNSRPKVTLPLNWEKLSFEDWIKLFENTKADVYVSFFTN
jgi:hypothetical protein